MILLWLIEKGRGGRERKREGEWLERGKGRKGGREEGGSDITQCAVTWWRDRGEERKKEGEGKERGRRSNKTIITRCDMVNLTVSHWCIFRT